MSIGLAILTGLAMGAVFGVALEKSRVFEPGAIISQMQLRTFLMVKIFLTAVATGLVVLSVLNGVMGVSLVPKGWYGLLISSAACCSAPASPSPAHVPARRSHSLAPAIATLGSRSPAASSARWRSATSSRR